MLFYEVEGSLVNNDAENEDSVKENRDRIRNINMKSVEFNEKFCRDLFFFVSHSVDGVLKVGVIADRLSKMDETLIAYLKYIECELRDVVITEIKFNRILTLLDSADRKEYITTEEITTIKAVDIEIPDVKTEEKRKIGFAY